MDEVKNQLRREVDSMDDFEHLGHDSSPLKEKVETGDLLGLGHQEIDKRVETGAGTGRSGAADDPFDPFGVAQIVDPRKSQTSREDIHTGMDRFTVQSFLDGEREPKQDLPKAPPAPANDLLDRYSDSEPELEDFQKKRELPKMNEPKEHFKDIDESHIEPFKPSALPSETIKVPELPKKKPEPEPIRHEPETVRKEPEPAKKEPEPAPVMQETPQPTNNEPTAEVPKAVQEKKPKIAPADAEAIFCKMGLDAWFNPERLNPKVESLIYWRDPKKSGPVFGGVLVILLALTYFSLISVIAYLSLTALSGTIAFRIYKNIVQAVQKTGDGHPFKELLEMDITVPQEKINQVVAKVAHLNAVIIELRRVFLVEDLVDSIKFGVMLWTMTYVGAWFNGMTLIIIAWVALFTLPKVYETNKTQIDANLEIVRTKLAEITSKVKAAIPIGKKPEEKKEQ